MIGLRLAAAAVIGMLATGAVAATAADTDRWERGRDPATISGGLRHIATGVFFTCSPHGGIIHVTTSGLAPAQLTVRSGDLSAQIVERDMQSGRAHAVIPADDPAMIAAASGSLSVGDKVLDFSEKDRRQFGVFLRICKAS